MAVPLFDLTGRRMLVTGSSQGIGLALAEGLVGQVPRSSSTAAILSRWRPPWRDSPAGVPWRATRSST